MNSNRVVTSFRTFLAVVLFLTATAATSLNLKEGHYLFEVGAYSSTQSKTKTIYIQGLIGDRYNTTDQHDSNALFGLGYFIDGFDRDKFGVDYGVNAFYLAKTKLSGTIDQEFIFTNLAYSYNVSHLPIYATAKAHLKTNSNKFIITLDAGIGPNFIETSDYRDWSLDGVTLPDNAFSGRSNVVFSAMAGVGLKLTNLGTQAPIECGYRFFYLGEGSFNKRTNQILNTLTTGPGYAQALICTVTV